MPARRLFIPLAGRVRFLVMRTLFALPMIVGILIFNFLLLKMAPGDMAETLAGEAGGAPLEYVEQLRAEMGLDQPVLVQLWHYLGRAFQLDFGYSFRHQMTVVDLIAGRLWPTLLMMTLALTLAVVLGCILGVAAARRPRSWLDFAISTFAVTFYAMPLFWLGLMLIVLFSIKLGWLPASGMVTVGADYTGLRHVLDVAWHLIMPVTSLALFYLALYMRLMRASVMEISRQAYVTTARAKGLPERLVMFRHILRNAMLPIVTMAGVQFGNLLGGSVVVETVFGWPGLGLLAFEALFSRDLNLLLGILVLSSVLVVMLNLAVDLLYGVLDPRISS